jgi:hypothetical protein
MLLLILLVRHLEQSSSLSRLQRGPTRIDDRADSSDFWRAIRERHPFALTFARGPRPSFQDDLPRQINECKMTPRNGFPSSKLAPILPSKIRLSFLRRQPSTSVSQPSPPPADNPFRQQQPLLQLPEFTFRRNDLYPHHTYPRSHHSLTYTPRVYLRTPQWELDGDTSTPPSRRLNYRRFSLPTTPNPSMVNSAMHMPVSVESSVVTSARASLMSIGIDSLALGSRLESVLGVDKRSDCI